MEMKGNHDMLKGTRSGNPGPLETARSALSLAMPTFNCPSRRVAALSPAVLPSLVNIVNCAKINIGTDVLFHADYNANAGSVQLEWGAGPGSWAEADAGIGFKNAVTASNGVCYQRSHLTVRLIYGGTSHIYLAGEKYLNPDNYYSGKDTADNQPFLGSDDLNLYGWASASPLRDRRGMSSPGAYGSNHPYSCNMVMCDGSATSVSCDIDPDVFKRTANRYVDKTPRIPAG
jgi:hypothetical protein